MTYVPHLAGEKITADKLREMVGVWAAYEPTWTASSGSTTLGDGTLDGRYTRIGNTIFFSVRLEWGSTTTTSVSTAYWEFALPEAPSDVQGNTWQPVQAWAFDTSASARWVCQAYINGTNDVITAIVTHADGGFIDRSEMPDQTAAGGATDSVQPGSVAWANGDRLNLWGWYEAA
ncbi:hypothetical protein [Streptomyces boncukensis]|uniref:Uncharacterized protein n=1 Tax=Streptomyces boncukensis TaxID=2711219 RepID=A0A6G4WXP3_9ACTN|nr:hypothetical protein [Streptomyces boncukensis]NGO69294.1 hypothetical protein [Streptomyces boncukensis]